MNIFHSLLSVPWNHTHPSEVTKGVELAVLWPGWDCWLPSLKTFHSLLSVPWNHTHPSDVMKGVALVVLLPTVYWLAWPVSVMTPVSTVPGLTCVRFE